jgi:hypothetical protein
MNLKIYMKRKHYSLKDYKRKIEELPYASVKRNDLERIHKEVTRMIRVTKNSRSFHKDFYKPEIDKLFTTLRRSF